MKFSLGLLCLLLLPAAHARGGPCDDPYTNAQTTSKKVADAWIEYLTKRHSGEKLSIPASSLSLADVCSRSRFTGLWEIAPEGREQFYSIGFYAVVGDQRWWYGLEFISARPCRGDVKSLADFFEDIAIVKYYVWRAAEGSFEPIIKNGRTDSFDIVRSPPRKRPNKSK